MIHFKEIAKILGVLLVLIALLMLPGAAISVHFDETPWPILTSAGITLIIGLMLFLSFSKEDRNIRKREGYLIVALILQPVYGALSDRFGRKPMLIWFGVMGVLFTYPLLSTLSQTKNPWVAFFLICGAWLIISGYTSITGIIKAELFPTSIRALGVGVPYALTVSIFGGTVDSVALGFKQAGHEAWFYWYATGCIFISLVVYLSMRDTLAQSRMEQHE